MDNDVIRDVTARSVVVPPRRPLATKVGDFARWPLLLIGLLHPPAVAGNGLEWDEAAVAHYQEH